MATRYCPITSTEFAANMDEIGFMPVEMPMCREIVFERIIDNGRTPGRFMIRIMSSVSMSHQVTRDCGEDAIRVILLDTKTAKIIDKASVHRTRNALLNTRKRAAGMWRYVMMGRHHCTCGSLMVERKGRNGSFLGCTAFPTCTVTRPFDPMMDKAA